MSDGPKIVLDTNILISAVAFPKGKAADTTIAACSRNTVVHSVDTLGELERKLLSTRLKRIIRPSISAAWLSALKEYSLIVNVTPQVSACRDLEDNKFLDLAICSNAVAIVSGDADLRVLKNLRGTSGIIPIVSPAQYLAQHAPLRAEETPGPLATLLLSRRK
jgi:uncharacterized protein